MKIEENEINWKKKNYSKNVKARDLGITLIALVVTTILLLVLAGITVVVLTGEKGIITKTKDARETSIIGREKEQVELAYTSAKVDKAEKYNEDVTEIELQKQLDISVGENKTIVTMKSGNKLNVVFNDTNHAYLVINGKVTKKEKEDIKDFHYSEELKKLKQGDYVKYDTGTDAGIITSRVIYDANSKNGLQICSSNVLGKYVFNTRSVDEAVELYNNAIVVLNNECDKYKNDKYVSVARAVGTNPQDRDTESDFETIEGEKRIKGEDYNYQDDYDVLNAINFLKLENNDEYVFGSRYIYYCYPYGEDNPNYEVKCCLRSGAEILKCRFGTWYGRNGELGIRPCFLLKEDIKIASGDGTESNPYCFE